MKTHYIPAQTVGVWSERLAGWALVAAAALLVWRRNKFTGFMTYEAATKPSDVLIPLSCLLLLLAFLFSPSLRREFVPAWRFVWRWARYPAYILLFYLAGSLWSVAMRGQPFGFGELAEYARIGVGALAFLLTLFFGYHRRDIHRAIFCAFFSSLVLAPFLFVPVQQLLAWLLVVGPSSLTFLGFQNGTAFHASLLVIPVNFAFAGALITRRGSRLWWGYAIASVFLFALLFWTGSRAGWLGAVAGMAAAVLAAESKKTMMGVFRGAMTAAAVIVLAFAILPSFAKNTALSRVLPHTLDNSPPGVVIATSMSPLEYVRRSRGEFWLGLGDGRLSVWKAYLLHGLESPVGFGPSYARIWGVTNAAGQAANAHSLWIELFLGGGVGALAVLLVMVWQIAKGLLSRVARAPTLFSLGVLGAFVGVLMNASFFDSLGLRWVWFVLGLAAVGGPRASESTERGVRVPAYKKPLIKAYMFLRRRVFGGRGLSRVVLFKDINIAIVEFLRGESDEFVITRGHKIYLDPVDSLAQKFSAYEPFETDFIEQTLAEGNVFVDVGASIGWYTLIAARKVGPSGSVFSFEPDRRNLAILERNVRENGYGNITIVPKAVSETPGTRTLFLRKRAWTGNSFYDPAQSPEKFILPHIKGSNTEGYAEPIEVPTVSLDQYLGGRRVDVIKIDTEGAEELVQRGMISVLKNNPRIVIVAEFGPANIKATGGDARTLLKSFIDLGFSVWEVDEERRKLVPRTVEELLGTYTLEKLNGTNLVFRRQ